MTKIILTLIMESALKKEELLSVLEEVSKESTELRIAITAPSGTIYNFNKVKDDEGEDEGNG